MFKLKALSMKIPKFLKTPLLISILVTFITSFVSVSFLLSVQPVIPLMYTLADSNQQLVAKQWLLVFPSASFIINFCHMMTLSMMKKYRKVLLQIFAWSTVLLQFLLLLSMIRIITLIS